MKSLFISALSLLLPITVFYSQTFVIEFNLKNNDKFKSDFTIETTMKQTVMGIDQSINMKMEMSFNQQITDKKAGEIYNITTEYKRMHLDIDYAFDKVEMDTDRHSPADTLSIMMKELMNKPFTLYLNKNGKISEINGFEKYITEISDRKNQDPNERSAFSEELQNIMGEELIKQNFTYFFGMYPESPVKINEPWTITYPVEQSGIKVFFNGRGTLVEVTSRTFLIRIDGNIETLSNENEINNQMFSLSGKQVSEILIDRRNGWPIKSTVNQEISGILKLIETSGDNENMDIPVNIKMRMHMNSIKQ